MASKVVIMKKEKQITCFECGTAYFNNLDACPHCACPSTYNLDNYKINTLDTNNGQVEVNNNEIENDLLDKQNLEPQKNIDDELLISQTNEVVETNIIKTKVEEKTKLLKLNVFKRFSIVKRKVANVILLFIISLSVFMIFHGNETIKYTISNYNLMTGNYEEALSGFSEISEFLNSEELITETQYQEAKSYHDQDLLKSIELLQEIKNQDYKDTIDLITKYKYEYAIKLFDDKDYLNAANYFNSIDYLDSKDKNEESIYQYAHSLFDKNEYKLAAEFFNKSSYSNSDEMYKESIYNLAIIEYEKRYFDSALEYFNQIIGFKETATFINEIEKIEKNKSTYLGKTDQDGYFIDPLTARQAITAFRNAGYSPKIYLENGCTLDSCYFIKFSVSPVLNGEFMTGDVILIWSSSGIYVKPGFTGTIGISFYKEY